MTRADLAQTREVPAITDLEDEWTERTVVNEDRRRVLRAMARREKALATLARYERVIRDMLDCDVDGELALAAEVL